MGWQSRLCLQSSGQVSCTAKQPAATCLALREQIGDRGAGAVAVAALPGEDVPLPQLPGDGDCQEAGGAMGVGHQEGWRGSQLQGGQAAPA